MRAAVLISSPVQTLGGLRTSLLGLACLCAGAATLSTRWIASDVAKIAAGLVLTLAFLAVALFARSRPALRPFWELAFAFSVLAVVQVLNNSVPGWFGTVVLHDPPSAGNPLASSVSGTVVIQLLGTVIAVVPVIAATLVSGRDLGAIYVRRASRRWLGFSIALFIAICALIVTIPLRPGSPIQRLLPESSSLSFEKVLALTPALVVVSLSNGFEEEFLFRGLFLQKYEALFGAGVANVLQALIFSVAHLGVTYTPSALVFIVVVVFPVGLLAGYLMRASNSVIVPGIVHFGFDMAIYVGFLASVAF